LHNSRAVFLTLLVCPVETSLPHITGHFELSKTVRIGARSVSVCYLTLENKC
jgi:hypothetical protein